eukprot:c3445_g1_i1.p1 GENE.c3445_g1_i1~~c3445_g1_i1.p1  ORF type:complete len:249 (-),score=34.47 c3445_g1_i1:43-789(-)
MNRNQYDTDVTTWSPQGRLHQVEYAMKAVELGSAAVGCVSKTHAVLATLMKTQSDLADHQRKIFRIDDHIAVAIAGLVPDGRVLSKYMRDQCMNYKFVYDSPMPVSRLVVGVADKSQRCTQFASRRPYGVGLLVCGFDETGAHLYQTCPSGNYWEYKAMAIGSRAQSAKTYLERNFEQFANLSQDELVKHALLALRETAGTTELVTANVEVVVVGVDTKAVELDDQKLKEYLDSLDNSTSGADAMQTS